MKTETVLNRFWNLSDSDIMFPEYMYKKQKKYDPYTWRFKCPRCGKYKDSMVVYDLNVDTPYDDSVMCSGCNDEIETYWAVLANGEFSE